MQSGVTNSGTVCAVVVTFHPEPASLESIRKLVAQADLVLVVDNGSTGDSTEVLLRAEQLPKVCLLRNRSNLGIAVALNRGIKRAMELGYEWVATFDQDSVITPGFFAGLIAAYKKCPERVALVAPLLLYPESDDMEVPGADDLPEYSFIRTAITSGSLIRAEVFNKLGFYDEPMFIDYVDYDFCLRMQATGYRLLRANRILLHHRLGAAEKHSLLGLQISIKSHSAWRRYYITRNRILVYRRYGFAFPLWCLHDFGWFFLELGKVLAFEQAKLAKLRSILKGLAHGVIGKTGPLLPPT